MAKFILIEPCDFVSRPAGGQLNFARLLLNVYKGEIATIGNTFDPSEPIGKWFDKAENGYTRQHFNLRCINESGVNSRIPGRLISNFLVKKHRKAILKHPCRRLFVQEHGVLMALRKYDWESICYRFPGVSSALKISRFKWAKCLSVFFDQLFFRATRKANVLLASADQDAVDDLVQRSGRFLKDREINFFPTRVDISIFSLKQNGGSRNGPGQLVSSGRLHWVKGWDLILRSLALLKDQLDFRYTYVGDGPDRDAFFNLAKELGLEDRVSLTGFSPPAEVANYLKESDLYLMGSEVEGWPTTLVEAYATGLPMVCTKVSGAQTIISEGVNGFVCETRDPKSYSQCILKALSLDSETVVALVDTSNYALDRLTVDLDALWK